MDAAGCGDGLRGDGTGGVARIQAEVEPQNISRGGNSRFWTRKRRSWRRVGVHVFTMRDIDERGMRE